MLQLLFIAVGGALGALARYTLANAVHGFWSAHWPLGTLIVNASGSLLIGVIFVALERAALHPDWRSVLMVGFLGAFTTFSTFSLESVELWMQGYAVSAIVYALGSVVLCIGAAAAGVMLSRALIS